MANLLMAKPISKKTYVSKVAAAKIKEKVDQIVNSSENNFFKIDCLKQIERKQYKNLIHELAYKKSAEELKDLAIIMNDLGHLTSHLGDFSSELKYYTEAAVFYQYVITILNEKLNEKVLSIEDKNKFIKQHHINPYQQLAHIQKLLFLAIGGDQQKMLNIQVEAENNKNLLSTLREETSQVIKELESKREQINMDNQEEKQKYQIIYVDVVRAFFENIADAMKKFLKKLYYDSEQQMAVTRPCKYAVIGLGSMALKQMTPYSDFEFAILTESDDYKKSDNPKIKKYFKNLCHLVNFKIINLGESVIPTSKYGLDLSHLVNVAVNLDLGGKTPLGRIEGDKIYHLIQPINLMLSYVYNKENWASHIDKNLPYILQNVCYVYGDNKLVETYKKKVTEFLHSHENEQTRFNYELRAIKILNEGILELDYLHTTPHLKPKETYFKGDIHKFQPELFDTEGQLFNVKQEIYRLPDRMIHNLGLYYGIEENSSWDILDKLEVKGIINSQATLNLKFTISFATYIRLKTYSHHKAQRDDMSVFVRPAKTESELKKRSKQIFYLAKEDLEEYGELFQYFYTALPFHEMIKDFCNQYQTLDETCRQSFFKDNNFYKDDSATKGFIYFRLAQYKNAESNFKKALDDPNNKNIWQIWETLGTLYLSTGNYDQAIKQFEHCFKTIKLVSCDDPHFSIFSGESLNNLGVAYSSKNRYDEAVECYNNSLKIYKFIYKDEPHLSVAFCLNNLGEAYRNKGQQDQAIEKFKESLKILRKIYRSKSHPGFAACLNNLGLANDHKQNYDKAIKYYEKSVNIYKLIYKDEPHPRVADCLNNIAITYRAKGQYDQAIKYYKKNLKIYKFVYKDELHPAVADTLYNLGIASAAKLLYDEAVKYYDECIRIYKHVYHDEPHKIIASSFKNVGLVYNASGQYDKAIECYEESLKIYKLIYQDRPNPNVVALLNSLGNVYQSKTKYDQAVKYYKESLMIEKLILIDKPYPSIANSLNNLGLIYSNRGKFDKAINCFEQSLAISKVIYNDKPHPSVVIILNSLGSVYTDNNKYDQAIKYYEESLTMEKLIHQDEPFISVADTLKNLGGLYKLVGKYNLAIKYCEESLKMKKFIYKDEHHPSYSSSLMFLGFIYADAGDYDQAINFSMQNLNLNKLIYHNQPHPYVVDCLNNLALVYCEKGQYDQAINCYEQSLAMNRLIYQDKPHPSVAYSFNSLGLLYVSTEQYDQVVNYCEESHKIYKLIYQNRQHPDVAHSLYSLGIAYYSKENYDQAIYYYEQSIQMKRFIYQNQPHPSIADILNNLGLVYAAKAQYVEAINHYKQCLEMKKLIYNDQPHPSVAFSLKNLGLVYGNIAQYEQAIKYSKQALEIIQVFENHPYAADIKTSFQKIATACAEKSSSNLQEHSQQCQNNNH
ncbi:tetratricopeptide repeat protein 28-like [Hydra vulgaris]|uniref:Tetratricopeptide repeat protein 28-like n=1 Tax=Hydra vulgaris TaxID=6087 RepID=A0ABM4DPE0_HYDVU